MPSYIFPITATADDQVVSQSSTTWPVSSALGRNQGNAIQYFGQDWSSTTSTYTIQNLLLRWDTSSIPDSTTITGATLELYVNSIADAAGTKNVSGEWASWTGSAAGDYAESNGTNAFAATRINTFTASRVNVITLSNAAANVNKTGTTYLRLGSPSPTQTSTDDQVNVADYNHATEQPAVLNVYYSISGSADQALPPTAFAV